MTEPVQIQTPKGNTGRVEGPISPEALRALAELIDAVVGHPERVFLDGESPDR